MVVNGISLTPCPGAQDYLEIIILGRVLTENEDNDGDVLSPAY